MLLSQVSQWVDDAKVILENSQKLASEAQIKLTLTSKAAGRLERRVNYVTTIFPTVKDNHKMCILVVDLVSKAVKAKIVSNRFDTQPAFDGIESVMPQLLATKVPWFVNKISTTTKTPDHDHNHNHNHDHDHEEPVKHESVLMDFISKEGVDLLCSTLELYDDNFDKISALIDSEFTNTVDKPFSGIISKNHTQVLKRFHELHNVFLMSQVAEILKESSVLENHLAQLLEMVTNHYDQCIDAFNLIKLGVTGTNFAILEADVNELSSVQLELHQVFNVLTSNDIRAQELVQTLLRDFAVLENQLEKQIELYKLFKDLNLTKFITLLMALEEHINQENKIVQTTSQELEALTQHYRQFIAVYKKNYFKELHYEQYVFPRAFLNRLTKFVNEELGDLQAKEQERRRQWLEKYGDYIPKEFRLPGDAEYPTVVQIITEGLEGTKEDPETERKILDLISSN